MKNFNYFNRVTVLFFCTVTLINPSLASPATQVVLAQPKNSVIKKLPPTAQNKKYRKGNVYTMRGGLLGIFSTGMGILANTLQKDYSIHAVNTVYHDATGLSSYIITHYKAGDLQRPIILVGHSLGANEQIKVADELALAHVPVDLLITLDAGLSLKVPSNVKELLNLYQPTINPIFKGVPLEAVDPKRTLVENIDFSKIQNIHVNHFIISENPEIQKIMLQKVLEVINGKSKSLTA